MITALLACAVVAMPADPAAPSPRFPKGTAPMELGTPIHGLPDWDVGRCAACHPDEVTAWERSGHAHARSWVFEAAVRREEPTWCVRCHAPQAQHLDALPVDAAAPPEERGVTCAACHADAGVPLESPLLCAGCHQFGFAVRSHPGATIRLADEPQQDTYGEWLAWTRATRDTRTCLDCHAAGGDHSMGGARRDERLRAALAIDVDGRLLTLRLRDIGHRFPTGDVMRWVSVEAAADPLFEEPVLLASFRRTLAVHERPPEPLPYLGLARNTTLEPGAVVRVEIPRTAPDGRPLVAWRVVYHLVSEKQEREGMIPAGLSRIVLDAGSLSERRP